MHFLRHFQIVPVKSTRRTSSIYNHLPPFAAIPIFTQNEETESFFPKSQLVFNYSNPIS